MDIPRLILRIYQCARERDVGEFQDAALHTLRTALSFDACRWGIGRVLPDGIHFLCAHLFQDDPLLYERVTLQGAVAHRALARLGMPERFCAASEFRADVQQERLDHDSCLDHASGIITVLPGQCGTVQTISLYRRGPLQYFSEADASLCHDLVPHLFEAQAINLSLCLAGLPPSFGDQRHPGAIVDDGGYILHAETGFLCLLRLQWPHGERLYLPEPLRTAMITELRPAYLGDAIAVRRVREGMPLFLRARHRLPVDSLTTRELAIVQCVAAGDSYKTIAKKLAIAPATVRNHIAGAHERLGVRSNAELVLHLRSAAF